MSIRKSLIIALVFVALFGGQAVLAQGSAEHVWDEKSGTWVQLAEPAEGTAAGELSIVRSHVENGNRKKAVKAAEKLIERYPDNSAACEEAMMLAGQAEFAQGRYYQAFEWYERQISRFDNGRYFERALEREFDIADAFLSGKKRVAMGFMKLPATDEGLEILLRIAEHAPGSKLAEKAMFQIAEYYYYENPDYPAAADAYDQFVELFPKSSKAPEATLQAARAMYASFEGISFDDTPLIEAEHRFTVFQKQSPKAAKKANVPLILAEITEARAQKLYETANFYSRTHRPSSARFYYKKVIETFPDTEWATAAEGALGIAQANPVFTKKPTAEKKEQPESEHPLITPPPPAKLTDIIDQQEKLQNQTKQEGESK